MIWEKYLRTVSANDPWEIALRWAKFASNAIAKMDLNIERTKEYVTVADDLLEAVEQKNAAKVDWLAEVIEPKGDTSDNSFSTDQYLYEHDVEASNAHNMAITGFLSCLAVLSAWAHTKYKSQLWEDTQEMSTYPEIIDEIDTYGYMSAFKELVLKEF